MALTWQLVRKGRRLSTVGLLVCTALIVGYATYRSVCTTPLTCDVGGNNPHFLNGTPHYFERIVPLFAITSGLGLAAGTAVMYRRTAAVAAGASAPLTLALAILVGLTTFILTVSAAGMLHW